MVILHPPGTGCPIMGASPPHTEQSARAGLGVFAICLPRQAAEQMKRRRRAPGSIIAPAGLVGQCVGRAASVSSGGDPADACALNYAP